MVPSPKVATYDLQPEMSANIVTDKVVEAINGGHFDFIVLNYANPDMVGHTGSLAAAIKAVEAIDVCLGRLFAAVDASGSLALVAAIGMERLIKGVVPSEIFARSSRSFATFSLVFCISSIASGPAVPRRLHRLRLLRSLDVCAWRIRP